MDKTKLEENIKKSIRIDKKHLLLEFNQDIYYISWFVVSLFIFTFFVGLWLGMVIK